MEIPPSTVENGREFRAVVLRVCLLTLRPSSALSERNSSFIRSTHSSTAALFSDLNNLEGLEGQSLWRRSSRGHMGLSSPSDSPGFIDLARRQSHSTASLC